MAAELAGMMGGVSNTRNSLSSDLVKKTVGKMIFVFYLKIAVPIAASLLKNQSLKQETNNRL